jgi:hypothetical protein
MIREGDAADALTLLNHALVADAAKGNALLTSRLRRGMGYAHLALGDTDAARAAFESAVAAARELSSPFEVALSLDGLLRIAPSDEMRAEREETFERLGVRATFPPLPAESIEGVADDGDGFAP